MFVKIITNANETDYRVIYFDQMHKMNLFLICSRSFFSLDNVSRDVFKTAILDKTVGLLMRILRGKNAKYH